MYEVGVIAQFEAAHSLKGDFGPATTRTHGHTYRVEVAVRGDSLQEDGALCDIGLLKNLVQSAIEPLHFQNLDEIPQFSDRNSTAELVAEHICKMLKPSLALERLHSISVTLWESPLAFARVEQDL